MSQGTRKDLGHLRTCKALCICGLMGPLPLPHTTEKEGWDGLKKLEGAARSTRVQTSMQNARRTVSSFEPVSRMPVTQLKGGPALSDTDTCSRCQCNKRSARLKEQCAHLCGTVRVFQWVLCFARRQTQARCLRS